MADDTVSESSVCSSASTYTRILQNYSIRFWDPTVCCKLRKRTPQLTFGINGLVNPGADEDRFTLLMKPVRSNSWKAPGHWVDKVTLQTTKLSAQIMTPKISFGFVRLQLMVCVGSGGVTDLAWKCSTRWSRNLRPALLKPSVQLAAAGLPNLEIRPHIKCNFYSPEMCGGMGTTPDLDQGYAHITVPRLQLRYEIGGRGRRYVEVPCAEAMDPLSQSPRTAAQGSDDVVEALVPTSHLQRQHPDSAHPLPADTATEHRRRFGFLRVFGSHR